MKIHHTILMAALAAVLPASAGDDPAPQTPKPGSATRQAICDAMRDEEELQELRRTFPKEIPTAILPTFWRQRLR